VKNTRMRNAARRGGARFAAALLLALPLCARGAAAGDSAIAELERMRAPGAVSVPEAAPSAGADAQREWTLMVYTGFAEKDRLLLDIAMKGLSKAGGRPNVNVLLQISEPGGATRYAVDRNFPEKPLQHIDRADFADYRTVIDFVKWAKREYPAKRYALMLYGHGTGWEEYAPAGLVYGERAANHIRNSELRKILEASGHENILFLLSCRMQMAEIAYEARGYADAVFGSEEYIWAPENVFAALAKSLASAPGAPPAETAAAVFSSVKAEWQPLENTDFFKTNEMGQHFSALDVSKMSGLAQMLKGWGAAVRPQDGRALAYAMSNVMRFGMPGMGKPSADTQRKRTHNGDLYHFMELAASKTENPALKSKSDEIKKFIASELVIANMGMFRRPHADYEANAHGVSVEIAPVCPVVYDGEHESSYSDSSSFARDSNWDIFNDILVRVAQRYDLCKQ